MYGLANFAPASVTIQKRFKTRHLADKIGYDGAKLKLNTECAVITNSQGSYLIRL